MLSNQFWQGFQIGVEIAASVGVTVWFVRRTLIQQQAAKAAQPQAPERR